MSSKAMVNSFWVVPCTNVTICSTGTGSAKAVRRTWMDAVTCEGISFLSLAERKEGEVVLGDICNVLCLMENTKKM